MKRIILIALAILLTSTLVFGASLNLKAIWDPNTEPDMASYKLYQVGPGARMLLGTIPHPPALPYPFTVIIQDGSSGTLSFVLTASDTSGNESEDSNVATYPFDLAPPVAPGGFKIEIRK